MARKNGKGGGVRKKGNLVGLIHKHKGSAVPYAWAAGGECLKLDYQQVQYISIAVGL